MMEFIKIPELQEVDGGYTCLCYGEDTGIGPCSIDVCEVTYFSC